MIRINESDSKVFTDPKMDKLRKIIITNGELSDKGNYTLDGALMAWYSPSKGEIVVMDPMWGYPRYVYDGSKFYKKASGGGTATLQRATLIKNVIQQIRYGRYAKLDEFDEEGNVIQQS